MVKHIVRFLTASSSLAFFATSLHAAENNPAANYPNKPIRFIVPFSPGAGTDVTARTIAQKLSEKWGHQVVTDNRTGAGGAIGVDFAAKAIPDGYTICLISASNSVNSVVPFSFRKRGWANSSCPLLLRNLKGVMGDTS